MRLCMFHPLDRPMERGWVGRVDGDRVIHLAAQTLQSFFIGGGGAREHADYALDGVAFLAPVLHPPTVRLFDSQDTFSFANATAIAGPGAGVNGGGAPVVLPRIAAVIEGEQRPGGFTVLAEFRAPDRPVPKDRDFALVLGPVVVTPDELEPDGVEVAVRSGETELLRAVAPPFDWHDALRLAASGTKLRPGDIVVGPAAGEVAVGPGSIELGVARIGILGAEVRDG